MGMKRKRQLSSVIFHAGACILGFFMIYPLLWLLASSFKSNETMFIPIPCSLKSGMRQRTMPADLRESAAWLSARFS